MIEIARGHRGRNADQPFRLLGRGEKLRQALIGKAIHAYAAVRLAARAQPADGLRPIGSLAAKGIELTFGIAPPAHILDNDVVAPRGKPGGVSVHHGRRNIPAVGLTHQ
jgi:hypothetical protein